MSEDSETWRPPNEKAASEGPGPAGSRRLEQNRRVSDSRPRIFISYVRKDGEAYATALRRRLESEHPELTVWQDRSKLEGGVGWWKQIEEALDAVQFLVLVMTPGALVSEVTRKEWRYARQKGVIVYPVKGMTGQLDFQLVPKWMAKPHWFTLGAIEAGGVLTTGPEWETFVHHLQSHHERRCVPFMSPDLPEGFVPRPIEFNQLLGHLLDADRQNPVAITTALAGAGGFGKTTLAVALCHHDDVISAFDDGILWVTLGEQPDVKLQLTKLYAALTGERPAFLDAEEAGRELAIKLENRNCLIVVDDVWNPMHLHPFLHGGKGCARLVTTRQFDVLAEAHAETRRVNVDQMSGVEAVALLARGLKMVPGDLAPFRKLARRLGEWPLLLDLANGALRQRIARGDTLSGSLDFLGLALERQGLTAFDKRNAAERHDAVARTVGVSLELLTADESERFTELAVFPEDTDIPLSVVGSLWHKDHFETERLITTLDNYSLLKFDLQTNSMRLHDVLRSYLARKLTSPASLHSTLVAGWGNLNALPDTYGWRWLAYHLVHANQSGQLRELLLNFDWLQAKLKATDIVALIADYDKLAEDEELRLVQSALRNSAHAVGPDTSQLAGQVLGRLGEESTPGIQGLLKGARGWRGAVWLRPLHSSLHPPGTPLLRTLKGHADVVTAVAVDSDGRLAVSGSADQTLKLWDLDSGNELRTLEGHSDQITAVAVSPDGAKAISGSNDRTLKVWDLESGHELRTLRGHAAAVTAVAVSADERRAVSGSDDGTLKIWDLESGHELRTLMAHLAPITAVAVSADGRWVVSGSDDYTLKAWDLESGRILRRLKGHTDAVSAVAVSADGRKAVSGSSDRTLKVWDLESGLELRTLKGHPDWVNAVAVNASGQRAVSGGGDRTLKVWDLESGRELRTLEGHSRWVRAVALSADGKRAVSGSDDNTLKVWNLESGRALRRLTAHAGAVAAVAVSADGQRAVSGSHDRTLKVWDVESGNVLRMLEGHLGRIQAVAVSADGRKASSGSSDDNTLKVWDLENGVVLWTLKGHSHRINSVKISADGRRAVSGSDDQTLRVWDLEGGHMLRTLRGHAGLVTAVAVDAGGQWALSGSYDRKLKLWDLEGGHMLRTLRGHTSWVTAVAVSADARRAVSGSWDQTLMVWDLESGVELRTLRGHAAAITAVAVSADGRLAVSGSNDQTLKVWDVESGHSLATFTTESAIFCCSLSPDGQTIVAGEESGRTQFLRLVVPS